MPMMKAIFSKQFLLWPVMDRRLIIVITRTKKFILMPKFGFYGMNGKTYFIASFGWIHAGLRIVNND